MTLWAHPTGRVILRYADCYTALRELPDGCVDAIVTDPPYGLRFMGLRWDYNIPEEAIWRECYRVLRPDGHLLAFSSPRTYHRMTVRIEDAGFEVVDMLAWLFGSGMPKGKQLLRPGLEPITLGRKGAGKLQIADCMIPHEDRERWPTNVLHDGSEEVLERFPNAPGQLAKASTSDTQRAGQNTYGKMRRGSNGTTPRKDSETSASRFFYCAKASPTERGPGNTHPTVKPLALMQYLCRLVTPPQGLILDPYVGSGSTAVAGMREGYSVYGIENDPASFEIARNRVAAEV